MASGHGPYARLGSGDEDAAIKDVLQDMEWELSIMRETGKQLRSDIDRLTLARINQNLEAIIGNTERMTERFTVVQDAAKDLRKRRKLLAAIEARTESRPRRPSLPPIGGIDTQIPTNGFREEKLERLR